VALWWLAGAHAAVLAETAPPAARTSLGAGFWMLAACAALALIDAVQRLDLTPVSGLVVGAAVAAAIAVLAASGALDQLSIVKEYASRREVVAGAVARHIVIVLAALLPTVALGVPLGVLAYRRSAIASATFPILNIVQTIPSIALFAILMSPLSGLAALFPGLAALGISGIGLAPAVVALIAYSLLPIVRNVVEGLAGVSPAAVEAARGVGMTPGQIFWRVQLPLALPVFLSGLRITTVQAIGLTAVAALIGAGGLGSVMFQGLFANALDLTMLGAVPVILLAVTADAFLRLLTAYAERRRG
jgi:osmoprotectant transport system permease protein